MPRVLRIINRFNLGGPTYNAAYLSKHLPNEFETLLVGGEKDQSEDSSLYILTELNITPVIIPEMKRPLNFKNDRTAYRKIKKIIREFKPDIVHTHASKAGALGRLAASQMKVPVIIHTFHGHVFHSYFSKAKTSFYKSIERNLAKKSTKIIAISELQKKELSEVHSICNPEKIEVIPLGFNLDKFKENKDSKRCQFRTTWGISDDEIAIGIIGRLVPIKDHIFFLRVAKKVLNRTNKKIKFIIIGDGEEKKRLLDFCKSENLPFDYCTPSQNPVLFTSWIKDADIALSGLDIVCLTSLNEGTPVSLIEAQANGKPIVSTNVGGIENVVIPNETAFLSEVNDLNTYTQHLLKLIENKSIRHHFSSNGNHVFEKFHYTRLGNDMAELYHRLLQH